MNQTGPTPRTTPDESDAVAARRAEAGRRLAGEIDAALAAGRLDRARRFAATAARRLPGCARLAESLAHLRRAERDPEAALRIIAAAPAGRASLRLLRAGCLADLGRRIEAHAELDAWARHPQAPLHARLLLAVLDWESDDRDAALSLLAGNLARLDDPHTLALTLVMAVLHGRDDVAGSAAARLESLQTFPSLRPEIEVILASLGRARPQAPPAPAEADVETLSVELLSVEYLIPVLVQAQERRPDAPSARLIAMAIERALPRLTDRAGAFAALARLERLLGDDDAAMRWLEKGLVEHPMAANLVRLEHEWRGEPPPAESPAMAPPVAPAAGLSRERAA
jgi:tetratricopeptide (TPR) repeat protein